MQNVGGVDVLEPAKDLVQEVTYVVIAQALKKVKLCHPGVNFNFNYIIGINNKLLRL